MTDIPHSEGTDQERDDVKAAYQDALTDLDTIITGPTEPTPTQTGWALKVMARVLKVMLKLMAKRFRVAP